MPSLVLIHDDADLEFARRLDADLSALGAKVWLGEREIVVGDPIVAKRATAIGAMEFAAVLLSPAGVASPQLNAELARALAHEAEARRPRVLPLLLAPCALPDAIEGRALADFTDESEYDLELSRLAMTIGLEPREPFAPTLADPYAARLRRVETHYARPKVWHCMFCGWRCEEPWNDYQCRRCDVLRPFAGGSATVARCVSCGEWSLALARFCEWCGTQIAGLQ